MKQMILFFILLFSQAQAATWTWDDVLRRAQNENMTLKTAREQLVSAQFTQNTAWRGFLPTLRANISASRTGSQQPTAFVSNGQVISATSSVINDNVMTSL